MSLLSFLNQLFMAAKKPVKPAPLPIPTAPVVLKAVGREVRLQLPSGYLQGSIEVQQVTRGIAYKRLPDEFRGTHTDADGTVVVPGIGTDNPGEFRLRAAASATNQAGQELVIKNPALAATTPAPAPAPAPVPTALPVPEAPTMVATKNLDGTFQLPAGYRDINQLEIEIS
jgi:hypothetical protein